MELEEGLATWVRIGFRGAETGVIWPDQRILCPIEMWFPDLAVHQTHLSAD